MMQYSATDYNTLCALAPLWARCVNIKTGAYQRVYGGIGADTPDWIEIPERQRELNRWADTYETWTDVTRNEALIVNAPAITENMYNERRRIRIEAGLIDGEQVEDDLTWLARNVDEWFEPYHYLCRGEKNSHFYTDLDMFGTFTQDQWLQRRRKLGLEPDDGVAAALDEMARINQETGQYDIKENPLIKDNGEQPEPWVPEVGKPFRYKTDQSDWFEFSSCDYVGKDHLIATDSLGSEYAMVYSDGVDYFEPIETAEQKAERDLTEYLASKTLMSDKHCRVAAEAFVDWLKSEGKV